MTRPLGVALATVSLALSGCSGPAPTVMLDTQSGPIVLGGSRPPAMPDGMAGPPPGLEPTTPPPGFVPGMPVSRNGTYSGTGEVLMTGGGLCISNINVSGFRVQGNNARYDGFRGRIQPDNGLQMFYGQNWIVGQFEGATFHGQLDVPGRFDGPGCSYLLNLTRVGP